MSEEEPTSEKADGRWEGITTLADKAGSKNANQYTLTAIRK